MEIIQGRSGLHVYGCIDSEQGPMLRFTTDWGYEDELVLLDELNIVLRYGYLPVDEVVAFLRDEKPADVHVIVTGRNAPDALIEAADLVTEMEMVKHPFRSGVKAQIGIEY